MKENWERVKSLYSFPKQEIEEMMQTFIPEKRLESAQLLGVDSVIQITNYILSHWKTHLF